MKARGLILIPYFGHLPTMFPFWLRSAMSVKCLDWLIITDDDTEYDLPSNVVVRKSKFVDVR